MKRLLAIALAMLALPALAQTTIVTRATKGSALTWNEVDANFTNLKATADGAVTSLAGKQPLDSDLTAIAALSTTSFGRALLELIDASAGRTALGLGTAATQATSAFEVPLTFAARLGRTVNTIDLAASGVSAGSCTNCDLTIDAYGRVTVKGNGSAGGGGDAVTSGTLAQFASTTSAQLAGVISNETGSGLLVFDTSPTIVTPTIAKLANLTTNGLVTTSSGDGTLGVTVPGTGILSAIGNNVGSAGAPVLFNGAGGTPSSLTLTNATGLPGSSVTPTTASPAYSASITQSITGLAQINIGTLTGDLTLALSGGVDGQAVRIRLKQDGTGSRLLTLDSKFRLGADITAVTLSTAINKIDYLGVIYHSADDKYDVVAFLKGF